MSSPRATPAPRAWTFLALGDDRQFAGNSGYDDLPAQYYRYDSTVPNHGQVRVGDLAVIRDSMSALGMGWISAITESEDEKTRKRCPDCRTTAIKTRAVKRPRYRCDRGHEFEEPREETVRVTAYQATYGDSWLPLPRLVTVSILSPLYLAGAQQHAIRELRLTDLAAAVEQLRIHVPDGWWYGVL